MDVGQMHRRFRANIEIDGVPAFWEDRLYSDEDHVAEFRVSEVRFEGVHPVSGVWFRRGIRRRVKLTMDSRRFSSKSEKRRFPRVSRRTVERPLPIHDQYPNIRVGTRYGA